MLQSEHNSHSPSPPTAAQGKEIEESGVKVSLGRRRGWEEGALVFFVFVTVLPCCKLAIN